jgi:hypothetical protein
MPAQLDGPDRRRRGLVRELAAFVMEITPPAIVVSVIRATASATGDVPEDYSADGEGPGTTCRTITRGRACRWGEDGLAGFCDIEQRLCLAGAAERARPDPAGARSA